MAMAPETKAATRDDVARVAGVSVATVSYVLNGGPRGVSEEKRRRVLEAVAQLDYRPNAIARSLRARRTHILGLVLPDSANPYFAALSRAVEDAATDRGYQVVVVNAAEDPEREATQIEALRRLQVDGLVWIPADIPGARSVPEPGVPTVQVDRSLPLDAAAGPVDVYEADHVAGGRLACEHVIELGHTRIAYLAGPATHRHAQARLSGVRAALEAAHLSLPAELLAHGAFDYASGAVHAARWCALPAGERPTAVICANDAMAIGALSQIAGAGLRVPQDVSVVGYDDIPQASYAVPPLTTVAQPLAAMGTAAVARLLERVEGTGTVTRRTVRRFAVRLVVRESSGPKT